MQRFGALFQFDQFIGMLPRTMLLPLEHEGVPRIVRRIVEVNDVQSTQYVVADAARRRHWRKHPTGFACLKCIDGRVHWPTMTQTAIGLVKPFRAMGGRFEMWWPAFVKRLRNWVHSVREGYGERCGVFSTYHYSTSDADASTPHLSCAGWNHDTTAAREHQQRLAWEIGKGFGDQVVPMVVGIETDCDEIILHGPRGDVSGAHLAGATEEDVCGTIRTAFPTMPQRVATDIAPFLVGNARHVVELRASPRANEALQHQERVIAVGHGFDLWIGSANLAVIVTDVDPDLNGAIGTATDIIATNLVRAQSNGGRDEEVLLFASVPYDHYGDDWNLAVLRAMGLQRNALRVIETNRPELFHSDGFRALIGVTNEETKRLDVIAFA